MTLRYKTKGNVSPQKRPKVYFCCHPADAALFFDKISDDILAAQNCAIWYPDDFAGQRDADWLSDLQQMQLFVIPVTRRFLTEDSAALTQEFAFAMKHHIPVLPLMQEEGLEDLFNQTCGNLHFLSRFANDGSELGYEEKLRKYLSAVLLGEDEIEKIRAAFDAYVFLSYRKKDRRYATELMRLIHKNDFCRDIAIWYDEFLTPGEDFNESIRDALQKSGLFVLTVTPNLVNEENYIMTTEYPMARQSGKPILPAEMVSTDRAALSEKYEGIASVTDGHDSAALSSALLEAVKNMAIRENDGSPEHNFFIGLAYLGGVDVEIDYARGRELIESAADAGLLEAARKMAEIYDKGIGVLRNHETVARWQERVVDILRKGYEADPSKDNIAQLAGALLSCADAFGPLGFQTRAIACCDEALKLYDAYADMEMSDDLKRAIAGAVYKKGYNLWKQGDFTAATEAGQKAECLYRELYEKNRNDGLLFCIASACRMLGLIQADVDPQSAMPHFKSALDMSLKIVGNDNRYDNREVVAYDYQNLGMNYDRLGNYQEAIEYGEKALAEFKDLVKDYGTIKSKNNLQKQHRNMYVVYLHKGDLEGSYKNCRDYIYWSEKLVEEYPCFTAKLNLANAYQELGVWYATFNTDYKVDLGEEQFAKALEITLQLMKDAGQDAFAQKHRVEAGRMTARIYQILGDVRCDRQWWEKGVQAYEDQLHIAERMLEDSNDYIANNYVHTAYMCLGNVAFTRNQIQTSRQYYESALTYALQMAENADYEKLERVEAQKQAVICYHNLTYLTDDPSEQVDLCRKGMDINWQMRQKYSELDYHKHFKKNTDLIWDRYGVLMKQRWEHLYTSQEDVGDVKLDLSELL